MSKKKFNITNDNIEWARYTWNPVTGCKFGCKYCYARDIAMRFTGHFNPTFHPERLDAPVNTKCKQEGFPNNVFVCSMADLFGAWVPDKWIEKVLQVVRGNPQWNFLFLTKNPKRYLEFEFSKNSWLGATADTQTRATDALGVFGDFKLENHIKFLSCEPLQEEIDIDTWHFTDYPELNKINVLDARIDWLIIGGQSKSTGAPAFQPDWEWVLKLLVTANRANVPVYFKPNLTVRPKEIPIRN